MKITILKKKSSWIFLISFLAVLTGSFLIPEQRYKSIFKPKKNNLLYKAKILKYKSRYSPVDVYKKYDAFENKYSCLIKSEVDIGSEKDYFPINLLISVALDPKIVENFPGYPDLIFHRPMIFLSIGLP